MTMGGSTHFSVFLLVAIILLCSSSKTVNATCYGKEKEALMDFKKDLKDPHGRLWSWIHDVDCCKWEGVVCSNRSGRVIQLHLQSPVRKIDDYGEYLDDIVLESPLSGKISHSLQNLTHLLYLDLSQNYFSGIPIPSFFGSLRSLRYLNLSRAGFQGMVPYQLGNLSSLRTLSIGGIPSDLQVDNLQWLVGLSNLEHLDMSRVNLSTASNWLEVINTIPSLVEIHLSSCQLDLISLHHHGRDAFVFHANFSSLTVLDLSRNFFGHLIPKWIFGLTALASLDLSENSFEGPLPRDLWNLTSLKLLDLSGNYLNGSVPDELIYLNNLISLNLGRNRFESFLDGIWNWSSLTSLDLSQNNFAIFLPSQLSTLSSLVSLDLRVNNFRGSIPSSIANISHLQYFDLFDNSLISSLPSEVFTLKDLIAFDASDNYLNGPIPSTVGNFTKLEYLSLGENALSGSIPSNLGKLSSLEHLDVSGNKLTGTLPESLWQLSKLEELRIYDNLIEGVVSESHLDNLTALRIFYASGNSLTLKVSASWTPRAQFDTLQLGSWKLGPQFPTWIRSQKILQDLNLSFAGISDTIPPWLFNSSLGSVDLSHNQLHGAISHALCEVKNENHDLYYLDLRENSLSGEIPDCWMNYPRLERIKLNSNNFTGSIPRSLFHLEDLDYLGLGNNSLTGPITFDFVNHE